MKLRLTTLGGPIVLASVLNATAAIADDYYEPRAYHAVSTELIWTGFYIGGHLGGAWSDGQWADVTWTGERVSNNASGIFGGGQIGYNLQFGHVVLGVEASLSGTTLTDGAR